MKSAQIYLLGFILIGFSSLLASCGGSDPYAGRDQLQVQTPPSDPQQTEKPEEKPQQPVPLPEPSPFENLGLEAPDYMFFKEGVESEYTIKAFAKAGKQVEMQLVNLPQGMAYDLATQKLKWNPSFVDGDDSQNLANNFKRYVIQIYVHETGDKVNMLTKEVLIIVENSPRQMMFTQLETSYSIRIEIDQSFIIKFVDEDFLQGPFEAFLEGFPQGASLEYIDKTKGELLMKFKVPQSAYLVKTEYSAFVHVYNPKGRQLKQAVQIKLVR